MTEIDWDCLVEDLSPESKAYNNREILAYEPEKVSDVKPFYNDTQGVKLLDIEEAKNLLPWEKVEEFKQQAADFEVITFDECERALAMCLQSRKIYKALEKKRKEITAPALAFQKAVKSIADEFLSELKKIEASLATKVEFFNTCREKKSEEIGVDLSLVKKCDHGIQYTQEYFEFKVEDISKIPIEFLEVNSKEVRKALSNGVRQIEGINIFKVEKTRLRLK